MAKRNGTQTVELIPGRNIVLSSAVGKTNLEELKWLTETILKEAKQWETTGWAYIADCSQMPPVFPMESVALVEMTKRFVEAGCKAIAFVEGKSFMIRIQAHTHIVNSHTDVKEGHFDTREKALDWISRDSHY